MCYFLNVAIKRDEAHLLKEKLGRGIHVELIENSSIRRHLGDEVELMVLTDGGCSCSLYTPVNSSPQHVTHAKTEKLRKRYSRKGWSEAKIARAIQDAVHEEDEVIGLKADLREKLCTFVDEAGELTLLVHWYDNPVDQEQIEIVNKKTATRTQFRSSDVLLGEDELLGIKR